MAAVDPRASDLSDGLGKIAAMYTSANVTLMVSDFNRAVSFCTGTLGLTLKVRGRPVVVFWWPTLRVSRPRALSGGSDGENQTEAHRALKPAPLSSGLPRLDAVAHRLVHRLH